MIELQKASLKAEAQTAITVSYEDEVVGEFVADVVVEDKVILELKSVRQLAKTHEIQLVNYLTATKKDVSLIINFAESKVEIKRKVRVFPESHD
jgi:GxxExxY protein